MQSAAFHPIRLVPSLGVIAVALHASACTGDEPDTGPEAAVAAALADESDADATSRTITLPDAPEHKLDIRVKKLGVFALGTSRPDLEAEFEAMERERKALEDLDERPPAGDAAGEMINWVGFRSLGEDRYEIELMQASSAALVGFGQAARDAGATRARPGSLPITGVEDLSTPRSWSDGVDSRTRLSIGDGYSANFWPFRTIGRMQPGYGCTGTLIGRRTVLTAGHCAFNRSAWSVVPGYFSPRRDPTGAPHGTSYYNQGNGTTLWVPSPYIQEIDCDGINCNAWDIAVIELEDNLGDTVGNMGFDAVSVTTLQTSDNRMRGYPSCSSTPTWAPSRPDDDPNTAGIQCTENALYGDTQLCDIYGWPADTANCWGDGWSCELDITCDGSPGMSGSGAYTYDAPGAGGDPVIFGVYSQYNCVIGGPGGYADCTDPSENVLTRITPTVEGWIAAFKANNGG